MSALKLDISYKFERLLSVDESNGEEMASFANKSSRKTIQNFIDISLVSKERPDKNLIRNNTIYSKNMNYKKRKLLSKSPSAKCRYSPYANPMNLA